RSPHNFPDWTDKRVSDSSGNCPSDTSDGFLSVSLGGFCADLNPIPPALRLPLGVGNVVPHGDSILARHHVADDLPKLVSGQSLPAAFSTVFDVGREAIQHGKRSAIRPLQPLADE